MEKHQNIDTFVETLEQNTYQELKKSHSLL